MTEAQRRRLEELRELALEFERLNEHRETVRRPAGQRALQREVGKLKRERRELVRALLRDGVEAAVIAPAADLTRSGVRQLGEG